MYYCHKGIQILLIVKGLCIVDSPWQLPLPLEGYIQSRVVVYFYSGSWIPIMYSHLEKAIKLHRQALRSGKDLVVFPADLDPRTFNTPSTEAHSLEVQHETNATYTVKLRNAEHFSDSHSQTLQPAPTT